MTALVTLTTDFGTREPSAAELKGVIHRGCPGVQIVDLSHRIARGDVMEAAFFALRAIPQFPPGTIHLVNVAPGPDAIIVSVLGQQVVCPDNGILTMLARHHPIDAVHGLAIPEPVAARPGQVFYGRDVFAPAVAKLAAGKSPAELGDARDEMAQLDVAVPERVKDDLLSGRIIHIDRFGNLVTNIHASDLADCTVRQVRAGDFTIGPLSQSYSDVPPKMPLALLDSAGYLAVAYNGDRADNRLQMGPGIIVKLIVDKNPEPPPTG
jgi:S-adenosylmethionine hydrolase